MYGNNFGYPFLGQMGPVMNPGMMAPLSRGSGIKALLGLGTRGTGGFSFSKLLNGASKTLGVVNQAIPIVKQVSPMMSNMKSMLKIASVFKDETDTSTRNIKKEESSKVDNTIESTSSSVASNNNSPNFFL